VRNTCSLADIDEPQTGGAPAPPNRFGETPTEASTHSTQATVDDGSRKRNSSSQRADEMSCSTAIAESGISIHASPISAPVMGRSREPPFSLILWHLGIDFWSIWDFVALGSGT
jgi:hypothetical protein